MKWEVVKIESKNIGRAAAFASVGRGQIVFNATATKQIPNLDEVQSVKIWTGNENGSTFAGFLFKNALEEDCYVIKKRLDKNGAVASVTISNKALMEKLFGRIGTNQATAQYPVKIEEGPDDSLLLVIKLK